MKSRILTWITAITLLAALAVPVRLQGQEQSAQDQQQHYTLSDPGGATQATSAVEPTFDSVVPRLIQFSGTVKDAEGKPAAGSVELTFSGCVAEIEERRRIGSDGDRGSEFRQPGRTPDR